jgi:hypothetical protein
MPQAPKIEYAIIDRPSEKPWADSDCSERANPLQTGFAFESKSFGSSPVSISGRLAAQENPFATRFYAGLSLEINADG